MTENIKAINNPLTIVGIFAALSEVAGTITIGLITPELQKTFIWFLIGFPSFLVSIFFITLFVKREALYSPSDYSDEANFMINLVKSANKDKAIKDTKKEVETIVDDIKKTLKTLISRGMEKESGSNLSTIQGEMFSKLDGLSGSVGSVITTISGMNNINDDQARITNQAKIISYLVDNGEKQFDEICNDLNMGNTSIGYALQKLEKKGLVTQKKEGDKKWYSINKDV